ncbi:MAG: protein-methionine-sulfoxide reductase catalytic subunit MsrP, partial [Pseudomonadota bacterium]
MAGRYKSKLKWSDVTPRADYMNRRALMAGAGSLAIAGGLAPTARAQDAAVEELVPNTWEEITSYNNFYEFGTGKDDPKRNAGQMTTDPWAIEVDGLVERPGTYDIADVLADKAIEERIYRLRCVEAWSMVVPWNGFELKDFLDQVGVMPSAKYVAFETLVRPEEMPGLRYPVLEWPYREGLRLDEAMHPLTMLST